MDRTLTYNGMYIHNYYITIASLLRCTQSKDLNKTHIGV